MARPPGTDVRVVIALSLARDVKEAVAMVRGLDHMQQVGGPGLRQHPIINKMCSLSPLSCFRPDRVIFHLNHYSSLLAGFHHPTPISPYPSFH